MACLDAALLLLMPVVAESASGLYLLRPRVVAALQRGHPAGRAGHEAQLAELAQEGGQAHGQAQHRDGLRDPCAQCIRSDMPFQIA